MEAAEAYGSTKRQLLRKVQFPLARPSILLGVAIILPLVGWWMASGELSLPLLARMRPFSPYAAM